jgi:cell fate regulator YaaT (PSP1 superfamily)
MGCSSCGTGGCSSGGCKNSGLCASGSCNKMNSYDWISTLDYDDPSAFEYVEVSFKNGARKEFFKNTTQCITGDTVLVEVTGGGYDIGVIALSGDLVRLQMKKKFTTEDRITLNIIRRANERDLEKLQNKTDLENESMVLARAIARTLSLDIKVGDVEYQGDMKKATFFFTSNGRVDFRELVRSYAKEFKVKIEMRQIGSRQESARIGGIGSCGRELCCSTWLSDFKSVNTTVARYQNIAINQTKLSGQCGRLKCCLNYELDSYVDALAHFPTHANHLFTKKGRASLVKTDIFKGLMFYVYDDISMRGVFHPLDKEKVKEIIALNKKGVHPEDLSSFAEVKEEIKEVGFADVTGEIELPNVSKKKKKKPASQRQGGPASDNNQNADRPNNNPNQNRNQNKGPRPNQNNDNSENSDKQNQEPRPNNNPNQNRNQNKGPRPNQNNDNSENSDKQNQEPRPNNNPNQNRNQNKGPRPNQNNDNSENSDKQNQEPRPNNNPNQNRNQNKGPRPNQNNDNSENPEKQNQEARPNNNPNQNRNQNKGPRPNQNNDNSENSDKQNQEARPNNNPNQNRNQNKGSRPNQNNDNSENSDKQNQQARPNNNPNQNRNQNKGPRPNQNNDNSENSDKQNQEARPNNNPNQNRNQNKGPRPNQNNDNSENSDKQNQEARPNNNPNQNRNQNKGPRPNQNNDSDASVKPVQAIVEKQNIEIPTVETNNAVTDKNKKDFGKNSNKKQKEKYVPKHLKNNEPEA